ncbi:MAG: hypothetical protein IH621_00935, partial [Krumholzibacteria bacterium]|nr:hypothetical protein [Candidatus Krumholzibacteria bacterium]
MGVVPGTRRRADLVAAIGEELGLIRPDPDRVAADCTLLAELLGDPPDRAGRESLRRLAAAAAASDRAAAAPVLHLIAARLPRFPRPLTLLAPLLAAADDGIAGAALDLVSGAVAAGELPLD